jgi:60 kDa SS-A/Ro ribonucleoprotein
MANKSLFVSLTSGLPRANAVNEAGGLAYKLEPKHALAQVSATGTFGNAFYSTAQTQLGQKRGDCPRYSTYCLLRALVSAPKTSRYL